MKGATVLQTDRLTLSRFVPEDAEFILQLVNEPAWLQFIGDRKVRTIDDARAYLAAGPIDMYERLGFGLFRVELKHSGLAVGMCGLIKRDTLPEVDVGYAILSPFRGQGYAREAAEACVKLAEQSFGMQRLLAITHPENAASIRVLESIGFRFEKTFRPTQDGPESSLFIYESAGKRAAAVINRSMPTGGIVPELAYVDVAAAAEWLCRAFGFVERLRIGTHRVQLRYGDASMVVVQGQGAAESATHGVMLSVTDIDAHHARAIAAGAHVLNAPTDYPYGERQYGAVDCGGHRWKFSQSIADVDPATWGGELLNP